MHIFLQPRSSDVEKKAKCMSLCMLAYNTKSDSHFIPPTFQPFQFRLFIRSAHLSYNECWLWDSRESRIVAQSERGIFSIWETFKLRTHAPYLDGNENMIEWKVRELVLRVQDSYHRARTKILGTWVELMLDGVIKEFNESLAWICDSNILNCEAEMG